LRSGRVVFVVEVHLPKPPEHDGRTEGFDRIGALRDDRIVCAACDVLIAIAAVPSDNRNPPLATSLLSLVVGKLLCHP
jgi:hypothetical protein